MTFSLIHSVWTVMLFILFIGIVVWAWSAKRKPRFDEAARLPLEEDDAPSATDTVSARPSGENKHG